MLAEEARARPNKSILTFYLLLITQTVSLIGSRMSAIAIGIWVFNQTGQATPLLLTSFFNELPGMLGGSLAGVLVDRWDRKWVLILADSGQALGSLLLLLAFLSGGFQIWMLYLVALLQGIFAIFLQPAEDATTTLLVPESQRERANGIRQMAFPLAGVVAPLLAGLVYAIIGVTGVIGIDLSSFLLAVVTVLFVAIPRPQISAEGQFGQGRFLDELRSGLNFVISRRPLFIFILYSAFINFLLNGPLALDIPFLIARTGSEALMGAIIGVMSAGALSGAALIAVWGGTRPRLYTILGGMLLVGLMFLAFAVVRQPLLLGLSIFLLFVPLPVNNALNLSILQLKTPPDLQGRVFALVGQLALLGSTVSFLITGPLVDRWLEPLAASPTWASLAWGLLAPLFGSGPGAGMAALLFATGLIILASTLLVFAIPSVRRMEAILPDYQAEEEQ